MTNEQFQAVLLERDRGWRDRFNEMMERITEARIQLDRIGFVDHTCLVEADPESFRPCTCGASSMNAAIQRVRDALTLSKPLRGG